MLCNTIYRHFSKKNRRIPQFLTLQLKKNILVPLHMSQGTKSSSTGSEMLSSFFLSLQIQDGDHYVKRPPPPPEENHLHAIIIMLLKLFFQSHGI